MFTPSPPPPFHNPTGGFDTNILEVQYVCLHPPPKHTHTDTPHWRVWYKHHGAVVCLITVHFPPPPPPPPSHTHTPHLRLWYKCSGYVVVHMFTHSPPTTHTHTHTYTFSPVEALLKHYVQKYSMHAYMYTL